MREAGRGWPSQTIGWRVVLLAVVFAGFGVIVGMTCLRGGAPPVHSDTSAEHPTPTAGRPVVAPAPATPVTPVNPPSPSTAVDTQRPAGANEAATERGTHTLPATWCTGPMPLQAITHDSAGRLVPLRVDPVRCTLHLDGRAADGAAYEPIDSLQLYTPGFRPEGVRLIDVGSDGRGWPLPTPLAGPLIGCPGELGVSVAQVESAAGVEPLDLLCVGVCVPVAPLLADPEHCYAAGSVVVKLSGLPLLWDIVSLRALPGPR